jgi:spore coat polysaccharide biosynthesis protein SpsF
MKIGQWSILARAIQRLKRTSLDGIVVLTTRLEEDDEIICEARNYGAEVYRGPELDVLRRYQEASEYFKPEIIIRATADNPLIDIGSVDRIIRAVRIDGLDYCMERDLPAGAATEAVTAAALGIVDQKATAPPHREHVTLYIKDHAEQFRVAFLDPPEEVRRPDVRITVDTRADFESVANLIRRFPDDVLLPLQTYFKPDRL